MGKSMVIAKFRRAHPPVYDPRTGIEHHSVIAMEMPAAPDLAQQPLRKVELWDLVSAFGRLVRETESLQLLHLVEDETPQSAYCDMVRAKLAAGRPVAFRHLFEPPMTRQRLIGVFLALLELVKLAEVTFEQTDEFGTIWVLPVRNSNSDESA